MAVWSPSRLFAAAVVLALSAGAAGQSRQAQEHYQRGQRLQQNGMLGQAIAAYTHRLSMRRPPTRTRYASGRSRSGRWATPSGRCRT